jgi:hypothetical protein
MKKNPNNTTKHKELIQIRLKCKVFHPKAYIYKQGLDLNPE